MNVVILNRLTPPLRQQFSSSPVLVSVIIVIVIVINILIVIIIIIITITIIMKTILMMLYDNINNVQVY